MFLMNTRKTLSKLLSTFRRQLKHFIVYFDIKKSTICWISVFPFYLSIQLHLLLVPNLHSLLLRTERTIAWQQREPTNLAQGKFVFALNLTKLIKLNTRVHHQTCTNNDKRQATSDKRSQRSCRVAHVDFFASWRNSNSPKHTHTHIHVHRADSWVC